MIETEFPNKWKIWHLLAVDHYGIVACHTNSELDNGSEIGSVGQQSWLDNMGSSTSCTITNKVHLASNLHMDVHIFGLGPHHYYYRNRVEWNPNILQVCGEFGLMWDLLHCYVQLGHPMSRWLSLLGCVIVWSYAGR